MRNNLILIKCNFNELFYSLKKLNNKQFIVWLPNNASDLIDIELFKDYNLFVLNWHIDFNKLIEQINNKLIKFQFKKVTNSIDPIEYIFENNKITNFKANYRIVSSEIEPFLLTSNNFEENQCQNGIKCFDLNVNKIKCCKGYITDLLEKLSNELDFSFDLILANSSNLIDQILNRNAHIAVGRLKLKYEKNQSSIDFSVPFLYSGLGVLIKQSKELNNDLFMFLKPFTFLHWTIIILFSIGSAVSLSLLEFNSPFGLNPLGRNRKRNYTLGSAISMVFSLMFMHTIPNTKPPKSWSAKWTQNFIAVFALIFIATYTAQMASILSTEQKYDDLIKSNVNQVILNYIYF
jgi:hypothetical protein